MTVRSPSRPVGRFSYDVLADTWHWDDEVFRIHGYPPGSVEPTTQLVLDSKHPDDRGRVRDVLGQVTIQGGPFSLSYRIIGCDGVERHVVLVGEGAVYERHDVTMIEGFYLDLTPDFSDEVEQFVQAALEESAETRATIEQAEGVLMLAYGLDPYQAFAMLRWWSRNRSIEVPALAATLVELAYAGQITDADLREQTTALLHPVDRPEQ
jgi:hypothetical protein